MVPSLQCREEGTEAMITIIPILHVSKQAPGCESDLSKVIYKKLIN